MICQHRSTVGGDDSAVQMVGPAAAEEDHQGRDVLGTADAAVRGGVDHTLHAALGLHPVARHLGRVEAGGDNVGHDPPRPQFQGQVLGQVGHGSLGGGVRIHAHGTGGTDLHGSHGGGNHYVGRVGGGGPLSEERFEFLHGVED